MVSAASRRSAKWWAPVFGELGVAASSIERVELRPDHRDLRDDLQDHAARAHQWNDVWVGAAVTALLFTVGKFLIGLYIGRSGVASGFGAAGSLVVVLVWVYYSAQIFLLGAEFTWAYAHKFGSRRDQMSAEVPDGLSKALQPRRSKKAPGRAKSNTQKRS